MEIVKEIRGRKYLYEVIWETAAAQVEKKKQTWKYKEKLADKKYQRLSRQNPKSIRKQFKEVRRCLAKGYDDVKHTKIVFRPIDRKGISKKKY